MEIQNENYKVFISAPAGEIPREELSGILEELMVNAMFYMNTSLAETSTKTTREAILYVLKNEFSYLPLHMISECFMKGALGKLGGTTKFTVRNVHIWLDSIKDQYQQLISQERSKEDQKRKLQEERDWKNHHKGDVIFGTALSLKLAWVYTGAIRADDWDLYSLDKIVNYLRAGETEKTLRPSMIRS
jgi:hypothetical protein